MNTLNHVAIIMDGNGRWANERHRPRFWGHIKGIHSVQKIVEAAVEEKLGALTLYAFSTENWKRSETEVTILFRLLYKFLMRERENFKKNRIQFRVIGHTEKLAEKTRKLIEEIEAETAQEEGLKLSFAFSYGGRQEIVDSVNRFIKMNPEKELEEKDISRYLYRPEVGDVDLMIRTAGDYRISNFLLWQISYGELFFTSTKWPDFTPSEFRSILSGFDKRERRFGGAIEQIESPLK